MGSKIDIPWTTAVVERLRGNKADISIRGEGYDARITLTSEVFSKARNFEVAFVPSAGVTSEIIEGILFLDIDALKTGNEAEFCKLEGLQKHAGIFSGKPM